MIRICKLICSLTVMAMLAAMISGGAMAAEVGELAPDFTISTLDGKQFRLADYRGKKPVYLIFWATWCPNCKHEIPSLKRIHAEFGDRMAVLAINVSINDSAAKARRYVKKYQLPYEVAFDEGAAVTHRYGVMGTPTQFIIDAGGVIRYRDAATPEELDKHFEELSAH